MCLRRSFLPVARVGSRSHVGPCVPRRALRSTLGPTAHAPSVFLPAVHVEPDRSSFVILIGLQSSLGSPYNEKVTALRNQPLPSRARFAANPCRTEPRRGIRSRREIPHAPPARGFLQIRAEPNLGGAFAAGARFHTPLPRGVFCKSAINPVCAGYRSGALRGRGTYSSRLCAGYCCLWGRLGCRDVWGTETVSYTWMA